MSRPHVLLLGGTREARVLAGHLSDLPLRLTVSLAGATMTPADCPGTMRAGGFGGTDGLASWVSRQSVVLLIDATHPFATEMSGNAVAAARRTDCHLLRLERPAWKLEPSETWQRYPSLDAAVDALPAGARTLLATGAGSVPATLRRLDVQIFLRSIEPLSNVAMHVTPILARPPFSEAEELATMQDYAITHLVTKNSGGTGREKLAAAKKLGLSVLVVDRPASPPGVETHHDVAVLLDRITACLALDSSLGRTP